MKVVTKYEANDGTLWPTDRQALQRDILLRDMEMCNVLLKENTDPSTKFGNGGGFIQHCQDTVNVWLRRVAEIIEADQGKDTADMFRQNPHGIVGRIIDDSNSPLQKIMYRVNCLDFRTYREYGQPFFAMNPTKADQVEWPHTT